MIFVYLYINVVMYILVSTFSENNRVEYMCIVYTRAMSGRDVKTQNASQQGWEVYIHVGPKIKQTTSV